jgi:Secretion system C-terminal sorting domain
MKIIILYISLLSYSVVLSQTAVFTCANELNNPLTTNTILNYANNGQSLFIQRTCVETSNGYNAIIPENKDTYFYAIDDINTGTAGEITLNPGFSTGNQTNNKSFTTDFNHINNSVSIMNYNSLQNIIQNEKFEIGATLDNVSFVNNNIIYNIGTLVNNFIVNNGGPKLNPFVDWEVKVFAVFKHLSVSGNPPTIPPPFNYNPGFTSPDAKIDAFYTKDFTSWSVPNLDNNVPAAYTVPWAPGFGYTNAEYNALGGYNEQPTNYPFRVRFSPPETGIWSCQLFYSINGASSSTPLSNLVYFRVIPGGMLPLKVGNNKRFFAKGDESFYPVGVQTYANSLVMAPELAEYQKYAYPITVDGVLVGYEPRHAGELYHDRMDSPYFMKRWRERITQLADGGANLIGVLSTPTSFDIEWEEAGNYSNRLDRAYEMDKMFELAEQKDIYLYYRPTLQSVFQGNSPGSYYIPWNCDWDPHNNGDKFCYRDLLQQSNGQGYTQNITNFLTDPLCRKYFKQRLRYLISRYGYSTSMGMFELVGELNQFGDYVGVDGSTTGSPYILNNQIFEDWAIEMATYVKTFYNGQHRIITNTYAGNIQPEDDSYSSPSFDAASVNMYDFGAPTFADFQKEINEKLVNDDEDLAYASALYTKTLVNGSDQTSIKPVCTPECGPVNASCDPEHTDMLRSMFQRPFSGIAMGLDWEMFKYPETFVHFNNLKSFLNQYDLQSDDPDEGMWHPGAVKLVSGDRWEYKQHYADRMWGKLNPLFGDERYRKADIAYLRRGDRKVAIGVLSNTTVNAVSQGTCIDDSVHYLQNVSIPSLFTDKWNFPDMLRYASTAYVADERIKLSHMHPGFYTVKIYNYSDPLTVIATLPAEVTNGTLDFQLPIETDFDKYIKLFTATKNHGTKSQHFMNTEEEIDRKKLFEVSLYPNPSADVVTLENVSHSKIEVLNALGKTILELNVEDDYEYTVNMKNYPAGIYYFKILNNKNLLQTLKFVKL